MSPEQPETVLELRIHGVNNTTPHDLLDLSEGDVVRSFGDEFGSFWQPTPEAVERGRKDQVQGESRGVVDPGEPPRGRVPSGVHREAYSWGGMVRSTAPGTGPGGAVVAVVARAAWTLLLPFSIANAAIWSWALPSPATGTRIRFGSAVIRLACLTLTVFFVLAFASVAIDLVALQCFRGGATVCAPLEGSAEELATWKDERRVALFSLLPAAALLVVFFVSTLATLRYNVAGRIVSPRPGGTEQALLGEPRFWQSRRETHRLALLHLTAGFATIALLVSFAFAELSPTAARLLGGASIGVLLLASVLTAHTDSTPYERIGAYSRMPEVSLGLAVALYAIPAVVLGFHGDVKLVPRSMGTASDLVLVAVVVIALVLIGLAWLLPAPRRSERAWHGRGPAVFLTLGLAINLILGSIVNVIAGDWLNGAAAANRLDQPYPECAGGDCLPREITLGTFYAPFLGITLAAALIAVAILAVMASRRRDLADRLPAPPAPPSDPPSPRDFLSGLLGTELTKKRAAAARLHLAEPFAGVLAVAFFVAILVTLLLPLVVAALPALPDTVEPFFDAILGTGLARWIDASLGVWVVIGAAITAGLVFGGRKATRPLALIWDLACFLPRAGHPFGAPCYTERAVPEVTRRIAWWLDLPAPDAATESGAKADPVPPRTVVLSAHSMGAVVAVAALFALRNDAKWEQYRDRISLLTFGVQLRPYFGRFFPELLGPDVIDCTPCAAPRVWARDPWAEADLVRPAGQLGARDRVPAREWINLWRLTDHLGFPAYAISATGNRRDRYAEEIDVGGYVGTVESHSWYFRTPAYRTALDDLRASPGPAG